jgi:hypothetical protein
MVLIYLDTRSSEGNGLSNLYKAGFEQTQNEITFQVHMKLLKILLTFCVVILHGIKNSEYENIFQETVFAVSLNF